MQRSQETEKRFEIPLLVAAVLTIPALVLEDQRGHSTLHVIGLVANYGIWLVFAAEVVVMLAVVPSRSRWLRDHPLEVAIVVLTPPFLLSAVQGIRVLRALRLLRLLRLGSLARHLFSMEGLRYASMLALLTLLAAAEAFSSAEHASFGNSFYWALQTMTTAGQGDPRPHAVAGKIVASVAMLVGIGFFAVVTGAVAQRFLSTEVVEVEEAVGEVALAEEDVLDQVRDACCQEMVALGVRDVDDQPSERRSAAQNALFHAHAHKSAITSGACRRLRAVQSPQFHESWLKAVESFPGLS